LISADPPLDDLRLAAEHLRLALAAGQLGDWSWDLATDQVTFSARGADFFGIPSDCPIAWSRLRDLLHEDDRERARLAVETALAEHSDYGIEYRVRRPSGEQVWIAADGRGVYAPDGTVLGMIGVVRDVTDRRLASELNHRLAAIIESSDDAIVSKTLDGVITTWNAGAERIFGYTADEAIGQSILMLIPEDRNDEEATIIAKIRRGERVEHYETLRLRKDGTTIAISVTISPLTDGRGNIIGASKVARDVTERTRAVDELRRSEANLREETAALEFINETGAVLGSMLELDELLQEITAAATKLTGAEFGAFFYNDDTGKGESYRLGSLSGAPREVFEILGPLRATPLFAPTFNGDPPIRSGDILKDSRYGQLAPHHGMPAGHLPVRSYLAVPVVSRTGDIIGGLFFGHSAIDVFSARAERIVTGVAAQAAVAIDNARLYQEVCRAADEREQVIDAERAARAEAERTNVMKDEFLATLSHELRTPLNAILGWSQVLGMSERPEDLREGLAAIERNARAQTQLIEDLLDMNRIISGKIRLDVQWVELAPLVESAVESVRPTADAKQIRLRTILDPLAGPVTGDPTRLQQVVWNLLTNAIKFTPKGGKVDVMLERVNSHLEITVHDSGIGIKSEFLPIVFERFRQADSSTTRAYGGLGLGLSIVKNLVELHGGVVRVKSPGEGLGATFTVSLPLAPLRSGEMREHPTASKAGTIDCEELHLAGVKILVIDDEPDARALIRRVLEQCQAEVVTAANAAEGIEQLKTHRPDLLISDIGMPHKDGYQFLREVRKLHPRDGGRTPAIALTAFARSEDRTRAMLAGYQVHIAKPLEAQELLATVGSLTGRTGVR
jgi:PAS domain S-box-containing protein